MRLTVQPESRPPRLLTALLRLQACLLLGLALSPSRPSAAQDCPAQPLQVADGQARVTCPCFITGERAGVVLEAPAEDYPIEILRVDVGWVSAFGGSPQSLERAIRIYAGGLPDPGDPIFSLDGPVLNDGFINAFDLAPLPGEIIIDSGPFTVTLEFLNSNASNPFAGSVVHDGNGCQPGVNVVFAIPGGWTDACTLGVTGDWIIAVTYRSVTCPDGEQEFIRGDDNGDGVIDIADPIFGLSFLFAGGPARCLEAMDTNDDGSFDVSDAVYNLLFQFRGGPAPPPPFDTCGTAPAPQSLGCDGPVDSCP